MGLYQNRIVVKVGTSTLTNEMGKSDLRSFDRLTCVLSDIQNMGYEVILVSSGAVAVGTNKLNMKERPSSMRMKQVAAAVGQCSMMFLYDKFFNDYDKTIAQILLNAEDMEQEEKKENLIRRIEKIDETVYALAGGAGSRRGTGGMKTKLRAAELATSQGIDTIITNGKSPEALYEIAKGNKEGTLFVGRMS